jgi:hypothetical protein
VRRAGAHGAGQARPGRLHEWARKGGSGPGGKRKELCICYLFIFQRPALKIPFLSNKNTFLGFDEKTKVVLNFVISTFAKKGNIKIPIYFEIKI